MTFTLKGVKIRLSFFFFLLVALFLLWEPSGVSELFFAALMIHEGGHLLIIWLFRLPVAELSLTPLLVGLRLGPGARLTPGREILLTLAGSLGNLLAAGLLLLPGTEICLRLSAVNAALGIFHLIPLAGLDGGAAMQLIFAAMLGGERGAAWAEAVMFVCGLAGMSGCLFLLIKFGPSLTPALALLLFVCGLVLPPAKQ